MNIIVFIYIYIHTYAAIHALFKSVRFDCRTARLPAELCRGTERGSGAPDRSKPRCLFPFDWVTSYEWGSIME